MADSSGNPEPGQVLTFLKPSKKKTFRKRTHEEDEEDVDSKSGSASLSSRRNSPKLDYGILVLSGCSLDPDLCLKLHDGGDDKSQWLIDLREFEKQRKTNGGLLSEHDVDQIKKKLNDYYDSLPVVCCICKQHFCDPVVTTCKHYFCSACALEQYSKNKKCFVCDEPTANIFKTAQEICIKMSANGICFWMRPIKQNTRKHKTEEVETDEEDETDEEVETDEEDETDEEVETDEEDETDEEVETDEEDELRALEGNGFVF